MLSSIGQLLIAGSLLATPLALSIKQRNEDVEKLKEVFRNSNLLVKTKRGDMQLPKLINIEKLPYGKLYTFDIPPGLELSKFKNKQEAIEHQLEGQCNIWSEGNYLKIESMIEKLEDKILFDKNFIMRELDNCTLGFSVGYSHGGFLVNDLTSIWCQILIAGMTNSGKSNLVNQAILSMILKYTPNYLEINLIDLKGGLESIHFDKAPHIQTRIHDTEESLLLFELLIQEMKNRYSMLEKARCRNIKEYKNKTNSNIPYIVTAIDEFAIYNGKNKYINPVSILLAQGRAAGIHMIISTQRPEAKNVLPGLLKANLNASISMKVKTKIDSNMILGNDKAAMLEPIQGRGIYQTDKDMKIQVPFIEGDEISRLIDERNKELGIISHTFKKSVLDDVAVKEDNSEDKPKRKGLVF